MNINHETLKYINIEKITHHIFGEDMHKKRCQSLANAALGVISGASLIVHRIGQGLASARNLVGKHAVKQVDRLLSNGNLNVWDAFASWVPYITGARKEIIIAMDWTDFDADNQSTIALNLVTSHGRATPLIWKTVSKDTLKDNRNNYEDEVLSRLRELIPDDVKVTILADRGFGDIRLYDFLKTDLNFDYTIRFRGNIYVTDEKEDTRKAEDWVPSNGRTRVLREAKVTEEKYLVPTVACVKEKSMKEPWCIVSSNPEATGSELKKLYAKRWGIEPQFRDTKDIHFGMGLSSTRIKSCERRDRILLISALSVVLLSLLGAAGEALGFDRKLKVNTVKHRTHSLFRQGCYYYQCLGNNPEEDKLLLNKFAELIEEKNNLNDILWVI